MKANELRIGNWVKRGTQPDGFVVDSQTFKICELHPDWYEPIPLTEEWLLKFGFEYWEDNHYCNGNLFIDVKTNKVHIRKVRVDYLTACYLDNKIQYVHQLQNLYFALTGEELAIKDVK